MRSFGLSENGTGSRYHADHADTESSNATAATHVRTVSSGRMPPAAYMLHLQVGRGPIRPNLKALQIRQMTCRIV